MSVTALILTAITWSKMHRSIERMQLMMEVRTSWERCFSLLKDAETGQRGYVLTGEEVYLDPFDLAKEELPDELMKLQRLSENDDLQEEDTEQVAIKIRQLMDRMNEVVVIRRREGLDAAVEMVRKGEKRHLMDAIRSSVSRVIKKLEVVIHERTKVMQADLRWGYVSALSTGVMALLAGGVALFLLREAHFRARREERLMIEKKRAEESNQLKSTFLATMSHEIRTPMNAILGFGELLRDEVKSEKEKRYVQSILAGGRSLLQLINDILDLSKIEAGMMRLNEEPLDVRDLAAFVQQLFGQQAMEKGIMLRVEVDERLPHSLLLDGVRLRQILINVVGNAMKFTDSGKVEVRFYAGSSELNDKSHVELNLEVEDTGRGIPKDHQAKIFQPFIQLERDSGIGEQHRGTGLGLTIVKKLTELIHGEVSVTSELGKGTKFKFVFSEVSVSARLPVEHTIREETVDFDRLRPSKILVADDNGTNRELMEGIFEGTRHQTLFASNGADALRLAQEEHPDVVLMDVRMPGMDGRDVLRKIRSKRGLNLLPVIAVTASSLSDEERQLRNSFDGYVQKPFSMAQLYHELEQFIPKVGAVETPSQYVVENGVHFCEEDSLQWGDLLEKLRGMEIDVWPGVRDRMRMLEVKAFAENLLELSHVWSCVILENYARRLLDDAESFSLTALENGLQAFPACINEIEARVKLEKNS